MNSSLYVINISSSTKVVISSSILISNRAYIAQILLLLYQDSVISKENTGPLDFDKEGIDCNCITSL